MSTTETTFTALRMRAGFSSSISARIAALDAPGQRPDDYGIPPGRTMRDEIGRYWSIAEALWKEYREQNKRAGIPTARIGVERWLVRLLKEVFGYTDLTATTVRAQVGERSFPISHKAQGGALPLLLTRGIRARPLRQALWRRQPPTCTPRCGAGISQRRSARAVERRIQWTAPAGLRITLRLHARRMSRPTSKECLRKDFMPTSRRSGCSLTRPGSPLMRRASRNSQSGVADGRREDRSTRPGEAPIRRDDGLARTRNRLRREPG